MSKLNYQHPLNLSQKQEWKKTDQGGSNLENIDGGVRDCELEPEGNMMVLQDCRVIVQDGQLATRVTQEGRVTSCKK